MTGNLPATGLLDAPQLLGSLTQDDISALKAELAVHASSQNASAAVADLAGNLPQHDGSTDLDSSAISSDEDEEDYDRVSLSPDTLVSGSRGGTLKISTDAPFAEEVPAQMDGSSLQPGNATMRRQSESLDRPEGLVRRRSIQVRLEKTDKKGRYMLTADDPEVREILRRGMERESAAADASHSTRSRMRGLVFTRQFTTFDRQNPLSAESPFHGFFTLFWLGLVLMFFRISALNWRKYGSILGNNEIMNIMFGKDVILLGVTDGLMYLATSFGFFLHLAIFRGWLTWRRSGWIIQNVWQACYLAAVIGWTYYRDWPWTHTVFVILHTMVFLMKQHSYSFYNGHLSNVYRRRMLLDRKLQQLKDTEPLTSRPNSPAVLDAASASGSELHKTLSGSFLPRRPSMGLRTGTNLTLERSDVANVAAAMDSGMPLDLSQLQSFQRIIEGEILSLDNELKGKCTSGRNAYPRNLNWRNFGEWTVLPTLVYELEYPRQEHVNWWYVAEKTAATFGTIGVMMVISQAYIYPSVAETVRMKEAGMTLQERAVELPWIISDMLFPLLLEQLLSWYVIWECVLNVLAELTRFADRGFYGDWWNSISWDEYARKWNHPTHAFLLRHVYHSSISTFKLSRSTATFVTFLLSALVHELVMACLFKKVRGYLFTMQLLQLPLVSLSRTKILRDKKLLGNIIFWFGLFVGPSVLTSLYLVI